jgi:hypothetical protein
VKPLRKQTEEETPKVGKTPFVQAPQNSDITANDLVNILYHPKPNFKYKLIVDKEFPLDKTLYRERNFK